jgi:hypothetical protein
MSIVSSAQNTRLLYKILKKEKDIAEILSSKNYDVQVIYTSIERKSGKMKFKDFYYNVDENYFYPAETVMLPAAALTFEKINDIALEFDINKYTNVRIDDALTRKIIVYANRSLNENNINFSNFVKRMMLVGDRNSYNYCYDFLNQRYFNDRMHSLGYRNSWFLHKFDRLDPQESRRTNIVTFFKTDVQSYFVDIIYLKRNSTTIPFYSVYVKKEESNPEDFYSYRKNIFAGKGRIENGTTVNEPMNFKYYNKFTLADMHEFLKNMIFPENQRVRMNLKDGDYSLLYKYMSMAPADSEFSEYASRTEYPDDYCKYLFGNRPGDASLKVFSNSGKGLGFIIDNSYVIDTKNGIDFFLTVMVKCNRDDIFGDNQPLYSQIGIPLMRRIAQTVHNNEIKRKTGEYTSFNEFLDKTKYSD